LIHENRFTYKDKGLIQLIDLGNWWEQKSGTAIPLGGIAVRKDIAIDTVKSINEIIKNSLQYSWGNYPTLSSFVTNNAQAMEEDVMRQHIALYVNNYTETLGTTGKEAIRTLFDLALKADITTHKIDAEQIYLHTD